MKIPPLRLLLACLCAFAFSARAEGDSVVLINESHYNPAANLVAARAFGQLQIGLDP